MEDSKSTILQRDSMTIKYLESWETSQTPQTFYNPL